MNQTWKLQTAYPLTVFALKRNVREHGMSVKVWKKVGWMPGRNSLCLYPEYESSVYILHVKKINAEGMM
jgi:hypothetical protein